MKTKSLFCLIVSLIFILGTVLPARGEDGQKVEPAKENTITVAGLPELDGLITGWMAGYKKIHPDQQFSAGNNTTDFSEGTLYFFTSNNPVSFSEKLAGKIVIGHEIIVPVMSAQSPVFLSLERQGITAAGLSHLLTGNGTWENIGEGTGSNAVQVVMSGCNRMKEQLAAFCEMDEAAIIAQEVNAAEELFSQIRNNPNAIGFCKLSDVLNDEGTGYAGGIRIVPIDKNRNGKIDGFEDIYSSPEALTRGAWIGKYPRVLCSEVFAASASFPVDEASNEFLTWIMNDGQDNLLAMGFINLSTREKTAGMLALNPGQPSGVVTSPGGFPNVWITVVAALMLVFLLIAVIRAGFRRSKGIQSEDISVTQALNVNSLRAPAGLFYDKTHTWAFMEQNGLVKVGVDDFLPHITGQLSQVKMKAPGEKIRKGEKLLTIVREGKHLDLYSPVTGFIKSHNELLLNTPAQLNADPYLSGWVYQVEPSNWLRETKFMFMADKFRDWLDDEIVRLKDFLAASANASTVVYNHLVLQDGGEITDNVLAGLEPEVWEDFQTRFIDSSK